MQPAQIGPYPIQGILGEGAMGRVYSAGHPELGEIAIKMLTAGKRATDKQRHRFRREVGVLKKLVHPNLVRLVDTGEHDGIPWLAMECVRGGTLEDRLTKTLLSFDETLDMGIKLCGALEAAHQKGVMHRDLKPENVMLTEAEEPILTDFGLAKDLEAVETVKLSKTGGLTGTPGYWAPELAAGEREHVGPWTDVYGLGAILYRGLTGRPPVLGNTLLECVLATLNQAPEPPSVLRPNVPAELEHVVLRCLEKDRGARYPSANALRKALEACKPRSGTRLSRALVGTAAVALVAAALWSGGAFGGSGTEARRSSLFKQGTTAYRNKDYPAAAGFFRDAAAVGEIRAMKNLGIMHSKGLGVPQSQSEALLWFKQAAEAGSPEAMNSLGVRYQKGRGTKRDYAQAAAWFRRAAEAGNVSAMNNVGLLVMRGHGVSQNHAEARAWFEKAAADGNANAMNGLGILYAQGLGVAVDEPTAVDWYRKGADAGDRNAMNSMGVMLERGRGVKKDLAKALAWYRKAADAGDPSGQFNLGTLYLKGTPTIAADSRVAVQWFHRAAEAGNSDAMLSLGNLSLRGEGVPKSAPKAQAFFERAAAAGNGAAMLNLGISCEERREFPQAAKWYRRALKAGLPEAQAAYDRVVGK
jgi:TPR repeat protein